MDFLGYSSSQLSAVGFALGAIRVEMKDKEFRAWFSTEEYVWVKSEGVVGITKLRGEEISSDARRCCQNYVEELGFRLGT
jgi:hypothetical protein